MDDFPLLLCFAGGGVLGAAGATVFCLLKARATAQALAVAQVAQQELQSLRTEAATLRADLRTAEQGAVAAQKERDAAREQVCLLGNEVDAERARGEQTGRELAAAQQQLGQATTQMAEREAAREKVLAEREKSIADLKATIEQSKAALTDTFKATGGDLLRQSAQALFQQAKEHFASQHSLSQQELESRRKQIEATLTPLKEQLEKNERLVRELGERREGDAKTLGEQLKQISDLQQRASTAAQTLSSALRDNRQRGRWGEVSLRNIAEMAGLVDNVDFSEQASVQGDEGDRLRPDMTVRLPGGRFVPIDAKVPLSAYLDSLDLALSDAERAARRTAHAQALRTHVRGLASREYAKALGGGVEITVLFVPLESGLIAALEEDATVYEEALDQRVIITTASTLLALLRTCALQWQQAKLNENARRIGDSARELLGRISVFAEHLEKVGKGLETASKAYNSAVGSFNGRLLPGARETAELAGDRERLPAELEPAAMVLREANVRSLPGGG
ncbi:MAG: DNA recombination protein RmuC [Verrucomicrobia bacterium]|nr:DNA recombination protein RmuC [Verrucomicrobiota bacterium]